MKPYPPEMISGAEASRHLNFYIDLLKDDDRKRFVITNRERIVAVLLSPSEYIRLTEEKGT